MTWPASLQGSGRNWSHVWSTQFLVPRFMEELLSTGQCSALCATCYLAVPHGQEIECFGPRQAHLQIWKQCSTENRWRWSLQGKNKISPHPSPRTGQLMMLSGPGPSSAEPTGPGPRTLYLRWNTSEWGAKATLPVGSRWGLVGHAKREIQIMSPVITQQRQGNVSDS